MQSEYAKSGVDYSIMEPFKQAMVRAGRKTLKFPEKRGVFITEEATGAHGAVFEYRGKESHIWCQTQEDLGNKNWIAEWMYQNADPVKSAGADHGAGGRRKTYYDAIAIDTALMTVNDVIAQGALPVVFTDQIEASESAWYGDEKRAADLAAGFLKICEEVGMAMPAGESASVTYIVNPKPPVKMVATLSGCTTGIIAPKENLVTGKKLVPGDRIIAAASSGIHSNGISLAIKKSLELSDQFLTKLPNGKTLGEEILIPTRSYVALIESLLAEKVDIHALLPGTGDGVGKLAFDKRPYNYRVHSWLPVPPVMQFMRGLGVELKDCLKTFNWGAGYYVFVPQAEVARTLAIGKKAGYTLAEVGVVEEGTRQVFFEPENITLGGPGEG